MKTFDDSFVYTIGEDIEVDNAFWKSGDYPLHYHNHFELEIVLDGSGLQLFNNEEFEMKKGDIYLLRPIDSHKIHSDGITIKNIHLKANVLPKWILQKLHSFKNPVVFHLDDNQFQKFNQLFDLLEEENRNKSNEIDVRMDVIEIIFANFIRLAKNDISLYGDGVTSKVTYYICKNNRFTQKIALDEIAKYAGYSKYYISSVFHKQYGITIQEFIIMQRVEYAKKLILETDLSITEIIMECGFASTSNFYSKFIKYVGCSPLQFRKEVKNKQENA